MTDAVVATPRLVLRPPRPDDADALARTFCDAEVMRWVAEGRPFTRDEVRALVARMSHRLVVDGFGQLVVERREDGAVLGRAGLLPLDPETWRSGTRAELGAAAEIEIGWTLERGAWGHGYGIEAAAGVRDHAREVLRLTRLVSIIQVGNDRSVRLAERLGERYERDIVTAFGKPAHLYALAL